MKILLRLHAGKIPVVRINAFANVLMFTLFELKDIPFGECLYKTPLLAAYE